MKQHLATAALPALLLLPGGLLDSWDGRIYWFQLMTVGLQHKTHKHTLLQRTRTWKGVVMENVTLAGLTHRSEPAKCSHTLKRDGT